MNSEDKKARVAAILIDDEGKLCVCPEPPHNFSYVHRAAMEVHWNPERNCLYSPVPREWTYVRWYGQIVAAVLSEYGVQLVVTENTSFRNLPPEVQLRAQQDTG